MKEPNDTSAPIFGATHIREVLQAEANVAREPVVETAAGLVKVTVDQHMRVVAIQFLDKSLDPTVSAALQQATADAINAALRKAVLAKAEALKRIEKQLDWKALIREEM